MPEVIAPPPPRAVAFAVPAGGFALPKAKGRGKKPKADDKKKKKKPQPARKPSVRPNSKGSMW